MRYEDLEDEYIKLGFGRMHYKQHVGEGKSVVFLHGFAASTKTWTRFVAQLPDDLSVYLIDLMGHGDSDAPFIDYKVSMQAQAVAEFLEQKDISDSYLFGHSYGAWVSALVAQGAYRGKGIVLEDPTGLKESFDDAGRSGTAALEKDSMERQARLANLKGHVAKSMLDPRRMDECLTQGGLANVTRPALVIWGSEDKTVPLKYAELFENYIKGSELEVVEGAGHVPHYTHPEKVKELLLKFIGHEGKGD